MKKDNKFGKKGYLDEAQKKLLSAMSIPLIVIVLIVIIVVADRVGKKEPPVETTEAPSTVAETMAESSEAEAETETTEAETEPEETEPADPFAAENFARDSVPEILDLMKQYFQARAGADAEKINQLYGIGEVSVTALEEQKTRMRNNSKYVTGFDHVGTYVKPGVQTDSWLVYSVADIRFRSVETAAPMMMWCYVTKNAEGVYLLADPNTLSPEILNYVDAANRTEEVRRLAADVNTRLHEALTADEELNTVYGILNADSPIWIEEGEQETEPEVKILEGETSAETEATGE